MAEKAQAEPTMEEILASIRKIISDEGDGSHAASRPARKEEPSVSVNVTDDDDFEDLSLDDVIERTGGDAEALGQESEDTVDPIGERDDGDSLLTDVDESMFDELTADEASSPPETETEFDEIEEFDLGAVNLDDEEPVLANQAGPEPAEEDDEWDRDYPATDSAPEIEREPEPRAPEPAMLRGRIESTASQEAESGLTDERIAGAAASALGKLMVKQAEETGETANPNTLEGLMTELLRPMIKEWLDANLPAIVERKVEEEVQRIARMAR